MTYDNANDAADELLESLLLRYQSGLEISIRGRDFIFDSVQLLYYNCHNINFRRVGLYIYSPNWIKIKKVTINPEKKDDKCF